MHVFPREMAIFLNEWCYFPRIFFKNSRNNKFPAQELAVSLKKNLIKKRKKNKQTSFHKIITRAKHVLYEPS
jgi:hypothetical protein